MIAMLKLINTLYYQYYFFFKNIIKEEDIPALNATLFLCALETFLITVLIDTFLVTFFCEPIPRLLYFGIFILILLINYYYYYYSNAKTEILSSKIPIYKGTGAKILAIITPLLVWSFIMLSVIYSKQELINCGYEGMFELE
jgi:hypothetical protein